MMGDWFPKGVFDRHPHRGIETVTYVLKGALDHYDNHGNQGKVPAGDVAWLTTGRGLLHNEQPADGSPVHLLQLWVNLPSAAKLAPVRFQELKADEMPLRREPGAELRLFSGTSGGATAPTLNHAPVLMVDLRLEAGAQVHHDIPPDFALSQRLFRNQQHVCTSCRGGISPAFKDWNRAGKTAWSANLDGIVENSWPGFRTPLERLLWFASVISPRQFCRIEVDPNWILGERW